MGKPFFYRITAADFLAAVVTVPEADRAAWVLSLALDMVSGDADNAKSSFAKDIITEAGEFSDKKRAAANKRWSKPDKQSRAEDMQTDAVHMQCNASSSSSSSTVTELKYKGDFESLWKQYPKKDGKKEAERHFFASVKSREDEDNIILALKNYCVLVQDTERKYIKNGSTWFNNWQDFVEVEDLQQDEYNWVE